LPAITTLINGNNGLVASNCSSRISKNLNIKNASLVRPKNFSGPDQHKKLFPTFHYAFPPFPFSGLERNYRTLVTWGVKQKFARNLNKTRAQIRFIFAPGSEIIFYDKQIIKLPPVVGGELLYYKIYARFGLIYYAKLFLQLVP